MTYTALVAALRLGRRVPADRIERILVAHGREAEDLVRDVFGGDRACPGDPCPRCGHAMKVVNTRRLARSVVRYVGCPACKHRPPNNRIAEPVARP